MYKDLQGQHWHCIAQGPASLMWIFWNIHLRIRFGQDLWSWLLSLAAVTSAASAPAVFISSLFYSRYTSFLANLSLNQYLSTTSFVYIKIKYKNLCVYLFMHRKSMYFKQFPVSFFAQSNALTTIIQESPSSCRQAPSSVSIRLWSKSLLVLMWDKGALSLFSWRVAMATWHKDISIAG